MIIINIKDKLEFEEDCPNDEELQKNKILREYFEENSDEDSEDGNDDSEESTTLWWCYGSIIIYPKFSTEINDKGYSNIDIPASDSQFLDYIIPSYNLKIPMFD